VAAYTLDTIKNRSEAHAEGLQTGLCFRLKCSVFRVMF